MSENLNTFWYQRAFALRCHCAGSSISVVRSILHPVIRLANTYCRLLL